MLFPRLIFIFVCLFCISANVVAEPLEDQAINTAMVCPIPSYEKLSEDSSLLDNTVVKIISKTSTIEKDQLAKFSGGVTLIKKQQTIVADEVEVNRQKALINAQGNIHFQNNNINIFADQLKASESSNATTLTKTSYQLTNRPGHGGANLISVDADGTLILQDSSFTTCYGEVPDWELNASEISISKNEKSLQAYNARFHLFGVPVIYIPYFSVPISDERQSGFLYPKIKSSNKTGLEVELPYYWNIAENIDATFTPRIMSKRGTQLLTEFRYLSGLQSGVIDLEYLQSDNEVSNDDSARYLARFQHTGTFSDNFRAYIDYTTISDDNYLVDLGSRQYNSNDAYLYQIGELSYFGEQWQATMKLQDFEVLGDHVQSYTTVPQVEIKHQTELPFWNGLFDIYSELSRFEAVDRELPEAERYHIESGVTFPLATPAWFLTSELKLLHTYYKQDRLAANSTLTETVNRTLPKVRFHGGFNLDREMTYLGQGYTQTLEPQIQYLYIPDKDQSGIGLYDTTTLQDDYNGLFRDRRYSGLDRIAQANQYSWGLTSRILNPSNQELFRLSVGKVVYLNNSNIDNGIAANESAIAADAYYQFNNRWQFSGDIQYNTKTDQTNKSQVNVDYHINKKNSIQLNHRYTRNVSGTSLEQLSVLASTTVNKNWQLVGRITRDLQNKRGIESYAGIQYESCCWALRLSYHRHIASNLDQQNHITTGRDEFDSGFMLWFDINGMSSQRSNNSTEDMFNSSIFGYKRPYFLNN
ncbi:LPS assembly protein LptD [Colwelliaceae bacterium 6471]